MKKNRKKIYRLGRHLCLTPRYLVQGMGETVNFAWNHPNINDMAELMQEDCYPVACVRNLCKREG